MGGVLETPRHEKTDYRKTEKLSGRFAAENKEKDFIGHAAVFAMLALYTFGKAVYDIGRNDGRNMENGHAGRVELSVKPNNNHHTTPYLYGTTED